MGKKKNGHKQNPVRKYGKLIVKAIGVTAGVTVAASPVIDAAAYAAKNPGTQAGGGFKTFTDRLQQNYGVHSDTGKVDLGKAVGNGVVLPLLGVGIMALFNHVARRI